MYEDKKMEEKLKLIEKQAEILDAEQFVEYVELRSDMIYGLDCCDLYSTVCDLIDRMPDEGTEKLRDLLKQTRDALYDEQLRIMDVTFDRYAELLKARDELKELKKKKKKKGKK